MPDSSMPRREWIRDQVRQHEGPLTIYATRMLGDVDRARDVVQDAFLRLWQADREQVEGHVTKWLYTVCRNRALDVRRKEQRMTRLDERPVTAGDDRRAATDEAPALAGFVSALPPRQQEAVRLKFQGGLSYREIAEVMDTTVNNVGVLLHTAVKSIRRRLDEQDASDRAGSLNPTA